MSTNPTGSFSSSVATAAGCPLRVQRGGSAALVLHLHGGFFTGGSAECSAAVAGTLAGAGTTVLSLDYPLAPEHPFPAALEAAHATLVEVQRQRKRWLGAPNVKAPILLAGEEAGGNLALALALMARDRGQVRVDGLLLLSPLLDAAIGTASQRDAGIGMADCPCARGWLAYLGRADDALHPYAVPARAQRLAGLPPTLLVTAEDDPLRDETRALAERLRQAQVSTHLNVLPAPTGWPEGHVDAAPDCAAVMNPLLSHFLTQLKEHTS